MRVVHIGFPKTATTFLQRQVFPRLGERYAYFGPPAAEPLFREVIDRDDTVYDSAAVRGALDRAWAGHRDVLFSYEPLTGLEYRSAFVNRTLIAKRLHELGFERVIITIRNQFDVLESAYKQYVKSGGVLEFGRYVTFGEARPRYFYPEYFDYFRIYRLYAETFGQPNVLILQYENLREPSFSADLARFLGLDAVEVENDGAVNPSLSRRKTAVLRVINHFTHNSYRPSSLVSPRISSSLFARLLETIPFGNDSASLLDGDSRAAIAEFYAGSNAQLQAAAGIRLAPAYP